MAQATKDSSLGPTTIARVFAHVAFTFWMVLLAGFAIGVQAGDWKEAIDATNHHDEPLAPNGSVLQSDLNFNPAFGGGGMATFSPDTTNDYEQGGLRVFPFKTLAYTGGPFPLILVEERGYFVAGRRKHYDTGLYDAIVGKIKMDGTPDTAFGANGWMAITTPPITSINDIAFDEATGNMYFVGSWAPGGNAEDFAVRCRNINTGNPCSGVGSLSSIAFDLGGSNRDVAQRVVFEPGIGSTPPYLYVGGFADTANGWRIAIVKLNATTGARVIAFGPDGKRSYLPPAGIQSGSDANVFSMALAQASAPGGTRLYVAGNVKISADGLNYDGYVLALNPTSGDGLSAFGIWQYIAYELDNPGYRKDAVTAITVQRNGKLAVAGWSETLTATEQHTILGRLNTNGTKDLGFCDNLGVCLRGADLAPVDEPTAILERPDNGDLVVALKHNLASGDQHPAQFVWQFGSTGNVVHAQQSMDFAAANGQSRWSRPAGIALDTTPTVLDPPNAKRHLVVAGTRKWADTGALRNFDLTLTHLLENDSLFADRFGGGASD